MRFLCNNRSGALQDSGAIRVTLQKRPNGDEDLMVPGHCVMLVDYVSLLATTINVRSIYLTCLDRLFKAA